MKPFILSVPFFKSKSEDIFASYFLEHDGDLLIQTLSISNDQNQSIGLTIEEFTELSKIAFNFFENGEEIDDPNTAYSWGSGRAKFDYDNSTITLIEESDGTEVEIYYHSDFFELYDAFKTITFKESEH